MVLLGVQVLHHDPGSHHPDGVGDEVAEASSRDRGHEVRGLSREVPFPALLLDGFISGKEEGMENGDGLHVDLVALIRATCTCVEASQPFFPPHHSEGVAEAHVFVSRMVGRALS